MPYTQTIQTVQEALTQTLAEVESWFARPEESRVYQPEDGGWSIGEILEHMTLTSHYLLLIIEQGRKKALRRASLGQEVPEGESDLTRLEPIGHPDAFPWLRPEHMEPTRTTSLTEVRERTHQQYQQCESILADLSQGQGALYLVRMSVQALGKMDMYQWLYFLALHQQRHLRQIERVYQEWQHRPHS